MRRRTVALAPKPFAVLCALARTPRMLVTKNALLDAVWGHRFVTDSVLKSAISDVRAVLQDDPKQPRYIETVSRRGYRFIAAAVSAPSVGRRTGPLWRAALANPPRQCSRCCTAAMPRSPGSSVRSRRRWNPSPSPRSLLAQWTCHEARRERKSDARRQHIETRENRVLQSVATHATPG